MSNFIGKPVKDESRKEIGRVLSLLMNPLGQVNKVLIEKVDGEYLCYPIESVECNNEYVAIIPDVERNVKTLSYKLPLLQRKKEILNKLKENNKILPEIYENLYAEFDAALNKLRADAQNLLNEVDKQIVSYDEEFRILHAAKTFLEIEHEIGNVEEDLYQRSVSAILKGLEEIFERKKSFQQMKKLLSGILLNKEISDDNVSTLEEENEEDSPAKSSDDNSVIKVHVK